MLHEVHLTHPGIEHVKELARLYVWWPYIDADIERMVNNIPFVEKQDINHHVLVFIRRKL